VSILEIKSRLRGADQEFVCCLLHRQAGFAVVHYRLDRERPLGDLVLPVGTDTLGYFWQDRPYNVYHFLHPAGQTLGWYCNISDRTRIGADAIRWRDLVIDLLLLPGRRAQVLDRAELPPDIDAPLLDYIEAAVARLLAEQDVLTADLEAHKADWTAQLPGL